MCVLIGTGLATLETIKHVDVGVWEMRIDYGSGYRVYFAKDGERLLLLLIGGDKDTQRKDKNTAVSYWQDYQERQKP